MATNDRDIDNDDELRIAEFFRPVWTGRRLLAWGTLIATTCAFLVAGLYYFLQPSRWIASLPFRPIFNGADRGQYPNGMVFSKTDVTDGTIIDQVFAKNGIQDFCSQEEFRSRFVVEETSPELEMLDADFRARLADVRLTGVDRQRVQEEYRGLRQALARQYRLSFVSGQECRRMPARLVYKTLAEVLEIWAIDTDMKRGVLKVRVPMLTPNLLDLSHARSEPFMVQADIARSAIARLIANVGLVANMPGAATVRFGSQRTTLPELRAEFEDLLYSRLDPLIVQAGRGFGVDGSRWVSQAIAAATVRLTEAQRRTNAFRTALADYSGTTLSPDTAQGAARSTNPTDVQSLTPQIDRTFIDTIVQMSEANAIYRQELTSKMVEAALEAAAADAVVEHYRELQKALAAPASRAVTASEASAKLDEILTRAKVLATEFNGLYDEFSRISMRSSALMYQTEGAPRAGTLRSFGLRNVGVATLGALALSPLVLAIVLIIRDWVRRAAAR
jgi:hypothetical protein